MGHGRGRMMERDGFHRGEGVRRGVGRWLGGPAGFALHVGLFLLGATILTLLNILRSPQELWFWRPLAWWGGLLLLHAVLAVRGSARRSGAEAPLLASPDVRPARTEPRLAPALRAVVARTVTIASSLAASGATAATRLRSGKAAKGVPPPSAPGPAQAPGFVPSPDGWSSDDDAAFASWGTTTDAWKPVAVGEAASASGSNGRQRRSDGVAASGGWATGTFGGVGGADPLRGTPTATGRFRPNGHGPGRVEPSSGDGNADGAWVLPADIEAMWTRSTTGQESPTGAEAAPTAGSWPTAGSPAVGRGGGGLDGARREEEIILGGSLPADPDDPSWSRLEAAAAAWLARRDDRSAPTPLPAPPAPTGTEGASSASS